MSNASTSKNNELCTNLAKGKARARVRVRAGARAKAWSGLTLAMPLPFLLPSSCIINVSVRGAGI